MIALLPRLNPLSGLVNAAYSLALAQNFSTLFEHVGVEDIKSYKKNKFGDFCT